MAFSRDALLVPRGLAVRITHSVPQDEVEADQQHMFEHVPTRDILQGSTAETKIPDNLPMYSQSLLSFAYPNPTA